MSLTGAHHDWPKLCYKGLPDGQEADRVLQMLSGCHGGDPDRSVSSAREGASAALRNVAAPPGAPQATTPDDSEPKERENNHRRNLKLQFTLKT